MELEEHVFLDSGGIRITNARIVTGDETYAVSAIESIKIYREYRKVPWFTLIVGVLFSSIGMIGLINITPFDTIIGVTGVISLISSALIWFFQEIKHTIRIGLSSGEDFLYFDEDLEHVESVHQELNNAIIFRN